MTVNSDGPESFEGPHRTLDTVQSTHVCMGFIVLITAMVLCAKSQDLLLSVSVRGANVLFSTAVFMDGRKPCPKTRETTALRRGIQKSFTHLAGIEP